MRPYVAVHVAITNSSRRVLFQRRAGTGFADGQLGVVSGHVHEGETLRVAAAREAQEEVGITVRHLEMRRMVRRRSGERAYFDFFLQCLEWDREPRIAEVSKCSELIWLSGAEAATRTDVIPYVARAVFGTADDQSAGLEVDDAVWLLP